MAVSLGDIVVRFLADTTELVAGVEESKGLLGNFGGIAAGVGVAAGAALVGIGVESVKMAGDFQTAMLSNVAHAGLAKEQINAVSQSVMQMSSQVGRSPTQLAEALYPILSAFSGIQNQAAKSAISLDTLKMSFQTVAGTTVDGTAVANAAVGTFNALGLATNNVSTNTARMTSLFDVMDKTVQLGNMQWDAYKSVVSKLAVSIQGTGITFNESQAALAEMTNEGFTAQRASTYLANTFNTLAIKTDILAKHAKNLSIPFNESAYAGMDLAHKIEYLNQVTDGNKQKLLALMGNNSTALKTFNALSTGIDGYRSNLDALTHSQGALKSSFDEASKGFNFQMSQMKAAGDALMITLGTAFLPVLTQMVGAITPLIQQFTTWETNTHGVEKGIAAVGAALSITGGILTTAVGLLSQSGLAVQAVTVWWNTWGPTIEVVGGILLTFFLPALIKTGVEAAISGVQLASSFIVNIVKTGVEALIAGPKLAISFVANVIDAGVQGWASAGKLAVFIGNLIKTGVEALIAGAKIAVSFVANMVKAGAEAVLAGAKIAASFVVSMVQAGTAAVLSGAKIVASFVASLITTAAQAIATGATMMAELVPAIIAVATEGLVAAATAIPGLVVGFIAWATTAGAAAIATIAATWPILAIIVAIGLLIAAIVLLYTHWSQVTAFLGTAWKNATSFIATEANNLAGLAVQWGKNLIQGFVNGIMSMVGAVGNAVSSVGNTIKNFLGIHSPAKMGPLAEADQWGPNLAKMYAGGMTSGLPAITNASTTLATPLAAGGRSASAGRSPAQTAHIHVYLGGKEIVSQLMPMIYDEARAMTGWRPVG